jgi:hypothetical protein
MATRLGDFRQHFLPTFCAVPSQPSLVDFSFVMEGCEFGEKFLFQAQREDAVSRNVGFAQYGTRIC